VRDQILSEIKRLTNASGGQPPGVRAFERATGITEGAWRGLYWARWSDALKEAGFEPNKWQGKSEADFIFAKFIDAARHYQRLPTSMELRMYRRTRADFPNEKTLHMYFGSKAKLLSNLRSWIADKPNYSDVMEMLGPHADEAKGSKSNEGLVYLIRSGSHYKIGRSDELERRVKEIRIALPEAATLVHSIRTDDPAGIEAYWHRRFADSRANGEWFKLTNADVAAFKRRKYQ
jgi:Meiotically Up-regulated Gene 113 (MUG113) protein